MTELQNNDDEWKGRKLQRPNSKSMSLHYRAMQNAGLIKHIIPCFAPDEHDIHKDFRTLLSNRDFAKDKSEEEKKAYKLAEDKLMKDTISKSATLITTLSKTADNKMNRVKKPVIAIVDEACQSLELETLLIWAHNTKTVLLLVLIGDPKQLPPTVLTMHANRDGQVANPFVDQISMSFFERLSHRRFPKYIHSQNDAILLQVWRKFSMSSSTTTRSRTPSAPSSRSGRKRKRPLSTSSSVSVCTMVSLMSASTHCIDQDREQRASDGKSIRGPNVNVLLRTTLASLLP